MEAEVERVGFGAGETGAVDAGLLACAETDEGAVEGVGDGVGLGVFKREKSEGEVLARGDGELEDVADKIVFMGDKMDCTHGFVFGDDGGERGIGDLRVVAALLEVDTVDHLRLALRGDIVLVHLHRPNISDSLERLGIERTWRIQYLPPFFLPRISRASASNPGAITPSDTSLEMILAVARSHVADNAMKSPKLDILSAPLARAYAHARGVSSSLRSSTPKTCFSTSERGRPMAAPAGETCLKEVAAGRERVAWSSETRA